MKKIMFLFLVALMFTASACALKEGENIHRTVKVTNNADYAIYVAYHMFPSWENPESEFRKYPWNRSGNKISGWWKENSIANSGETNTSAIYISGPYDAIESMGPNGRMRVYIVDAALYDQIPIGAPIPNETLLDRRDYTIEDLRAISFHIYYPWDE